ncbi:MAG: signal peptidase I [Candidatus Hydrogenedens sp.]|nr:signal peptidase I [Candidatus Hydrogenedens sp.]
MNPEPSQNPGNPAFTGKDQPGQSLIRKLLYSKQIGLWVLFIVLAILLFFFVGRNMRFFMVPSASMEPTLFPGDMIVTLNEPEYKRGDVIVLEKDEEFLVKRIVGLPGDSLSIIDGALFINGKYASEPYVRESMQYYIDEPVLIPPGCFFYLGDNRNMSEDSSRGYAHFAGDYDEETRLSYLGVLDDIVGKVRCIYYPYNRLGSLPSYALTNIAGH